MIDNLETLKRYTTSERALVVGTARRVALVRRYGERVLVAICFFIDPISIIM